MSLRSRSANVSIDSKSRPLPRGVHELKDKLFTLESEVSFATLQRPMDLLDDYQAVPFSSTITSSPTSEISTAASEKWFFVYIMGHVLLCKRFLSYSSIASSVFLLHSFQGVSADKASSGLQILHLYIL